MRLDKYLSQNDRYTRSEIKKILKAKRVTVNNEIIKTGKFQVDEDKDEIKIDGILFYNMMAKIYFMLNKPKGVVSATKDDESKTVIDLINYDGKKDSLSPVGRLDKDTTGLLIITNDGDFIHKVISPKKHITKVYEALVTGRIGDEEIEKFAYGLKLINGDKLLPAKLEVLSYFESENVSQVRVSIDEGKYHQIKRMFGAVSQKVIELKRVRIGNLNLDESLVLGQSRIITNDELQLIWK